MNRFLPLLFILTPIVIAFYFAEWQVVVAMLIGVLVVPFLLILLFHGFEVLLLYKKLDISGVLAVGGMFAIIGLPIYLMVIMPIYYALKSLPYPLVYTFPCSISVIMFLLFILITTKPWGYKEFLLVVFCSLVHSFLIIALISRFKAISI